MPPRARVLFLAIPASVPLWGAALSHAQMRVELRLVERAGRTQVSSASAVLNLAVQGRVVGATPDVGLGGFTFAVIVNGEPQSFGTLGRDWTSNSDGTYATAIGGAGPYNGVPFQYFYLSNLSGQFNGIINGSGGGWTQTASQDIGLISGYSAGQYFLGCPGVDTDFDGNPDTASGGVAKLPDEIMSTYFGASESWIDLYRFRYTASVFVPRMLDFHIVTSSSDPDPTAFVFSEARQTDGSWGAINTEVSIASGDIEGLVIPVVPGPGATLALALGGALATQRRRRS